MTYKSTYKPVEEAVEAVEKVVEPMRDELKEYVHKGEEKFEDAKARGEKAVRKFVPPARKRVMKVVDSQFDYLDMLLKRQRKYAHTMINMVFDVIAPKVTPKKAPAAKKPTTAKPRKAVSAA